MIKIKQYLRGGGLSRSKAREILHDKTAHGKPLTEKQRKFFGAVASGYAKFDEGGEIEDEREEEDDDKEMVEGIADILRQVKSISNRRQIAKNMMDDFEEEDVEYNPGKFLSMARIMRRGGIPKFQKAGIFGDPNSKTHYIFAEELDGDGEKEPFLVEANDLQSVIKRYYPNDKVEIISGYQSNESDFKKKVKDVTNRMNPANSYAYVLGHHGGRRYAGIPVDDWASMLRGKYENCFLGSCGSEDLVSGRSSSVQGEIMGEEPYIDKKIIPAFGALKNFYYRPSSPWLGVDPNFKFDPKKDRLGNIISSFYGTTSVKQNLPTKQQMLDHDNKYRHLFDKAQTEIENNKEYQNLANETSKLYDILDNKNPSKEEKDKLISQIRTLNQKQATIRDRIFAEINKINSKRPTPYTSPYIITSPREGIEYRLSNPSDLDINIHDVKKAISPFMNIRMFENGGLVKYQRKGEVTETNKNEPLPQHQKIYEEQLGKKIKWYEGRVNHENPEIANEARIVLEQLKQYPKTLDIVKYAPYAELHQLGVLGRYYPSKNQLLLSDPNKPIFPENIPLLNRPYMNSLRNNPKTVNEMIEGRKLAEGNFVVGHEIDHYLDVPALDVISKHNKEIYKGYVSPGDYSKLYKQDYKTQSSREFLPSYYWATGSGGVQGQFGPVYSRLQNAEMKRSLDDARNLYGIDPSKNSTPEDWKNILEKSRQKLFDRNISEEERLRHSQILDMFRTQGNDPAKMSQLNNLIVESNVLPSQSLTFAKYGGMKKLLRKKLKNSSSFSKFARGGMTPHQMWNFLFEGDDDESQQTVKQNTAPSTKEVEDLKKANQEQAFKIEQLQTRNAAMDYYNSVIGSNNNYQSTYIPPDYSQYYNTPIEDSPYSGGFFGNNTTPIKTQTWGKTPVDNSKFNWSGVNKIYGFEE